MIRPHCSNRYLQCFIFCTQMNVSQGSRDLKASESLVYRPQDRLETGAGANFTQRQPDIPRRPRHRRTPLATTSQRRAGPDGELAHVGQREPVREASERKEEVHLTRLQRFPWPQACRPGVHPQGLRAAQETVGVPGNDLTGRNRRPELQHAALVVDHDRRRPASGQPLLLSARHTVAHREREWEKRDTKRDVEALGSVGGNTRARRAFIKSG